MHPTFLSLIAICSLVIASSDKAHPSNLDSPIMRGDHQVGGKTMKDSPVAQGPPQGMNNNPTGKIDDSHKYDAIYLEEYATVEELLERGVLVMDYDGTMGTSPLIFHHHHHHHHRCRCNDYLNGQRPRRVNAPADLRSGKPHDGSANRGVHTQV